MPGRQSKSKGYRGEIILRDHLRKTGWQADRVPMSGAIASMPHDVKAKKADKEANFEMKFKEEFKTIYALYEEHCRVKQDDVLSFVCPGEARLCCAISMSLDAVFDGPDYFEFQERHPLHKEFKRTFEKLARMQRLLKGADVLVLKMRHKPLLFVRYR